MNILEDENRIFHAKPCNCVPLCNMAKITLLLKYTFDI